jgi:YggT family protein
MITLLYYVVLIYTFIMLARVISSWIPVPPGGGLARVVGFVYEVTEPVLRPLRNMLPPMRMGAMGLDLSPMIVFVVLFLLLGYLHP